MSCLKTYINSLKLLLCIILKFLFLTCILFFIVECSTPPIKVGLGFIDVSQLIEPIYVEGDRVIYFCTGSGQISGEEISDCEDDGRWSVQILPVCCRFLKNGGKELLLSIKTISAFILKWEPMTRESFTNNVYSVFYIQDQRLVL